MGRRAAPVGDPWKANGHAAEGSQSDRWIPVQLGVCAPRCRLAPGLRVLISVGDAGEEPTGWSNARSCPARMDTLPSWFVASPPHLARGVRLEPRVRIPRRQQQGGVHQRRGHCAGELARVAHLVDGVPDHRSGQRIQDLDDPCHQLPRHTPFARTTGVQLGSGLFLTDRGWRVLPAWLFSLTGVQNSAKVLAVGPSAIYSAPVTRGGDSAAQVSVAVGAGGRHIVANFVGAAAGTGPCTASYALSVKESKQAAAVAVVSHPHAQTATGKRQRQTYVACSSVGYLRHASAELEAPLGERVVVDAKSEGAASATPAPAHRARGDRS